MSQHHAKILWKRETSDFNYNTFDRTHTITYAGGVSIKSSSAPEYSGNSQYPNPEELLASALATCHMLTFLAIASKSKIVVNSYEDNAVATLDKNAEGIICVTRITLNPKITFETKPDDAKLKDLHQKAHKLCFIANSIKCEVEIKPH